MSRRRWFFTVIGLLLWVLTLYGCGGVPSPLQITSITHSPEYPELGQSVTFKIEYANQSSEQTFNQVVLDVMDYDEYLLFDSSGPVQPVTVADRHVQWDIGSLQPGDVGAVEITFIVSKDTPTSNPKLSVNAQISGTTSENTLYNDSGNDTTYVAGIATFTPIPEPVVDTYQDQGVKIELPWQNQGFAIHSRASDSTPESTVVAGGYEFIKSIIYLDVYDEQEKVVNEFAPEITLYVDIPTDLKPLAESKQLVILLYDKVAGQWIPCDGNLENNPTTTTACTGTFISGDFSVAQITISRWTSGVGLGKR